MCTYIYKLFLYFLLYLITQPEKIQQIYFSVLSFVFGVLPDALKQVRVHVWTMVTRVAFMYLSIPNNIVFDDYTMYLD